MLSSSEKAYTTLESIWLKEICSKLTMQGAQF